MIGWQSDQVMRKHYGCEKAVVFAEEEDCGIVWLETMGCGKLVIG